MKKGGIRKRRQESFLSVITVNFNDKAGLEKTLTSLVEQEADLEIVVIDGGSTDGSVDILEAFNDQLDYWVSEKDKGIYDAMNKGLDQITGGLHVFINSGDYLEGQVLIDSIDAPCFLPVKFTDYKGKHRFVTVRNIRHGIPYCHQGIVFRTGNIRYRTEFSIVGDYVYYLEHSNKTLYPQKETPGYIAYGNVGVSTTKYKERDEQVGKVILEFFGWPSYLKFRAVSFVKTCVKRLLGR